jgi:putative acetyltransferase
LVKDVSNRMGFEIREDDLSGKETRSLLAFHLEKMRENTPEENVFALDFNGLQSPDIVVWTAWAGTEIAGIGALKRLNEHQGEIKSMRTHPHYLRRGIGETLLDHIIANAKTGRLRRLSLETGAGPAFDPAIALYRKREFLPGEAFGSYEPSAFNQFFHLDLL